ncbi:MAG TPA: TolC family protein [Phycisphaerales bacterium]|nr:TolC family protein [Phycisphaerales bacterium]
MKRLKMITIMGLLACLFGSSCQPENAQTGLYEYHRVNIDAKISKIATAETSSALELNAASGLSDYLAYAALHNPGLHAAFNRFKAEFEKIDQVTALPDPRFTYKYFIEEVETRVGPQQQSFAISQAFPWFGKLDLKGDIALQAANAAKQRYEAAKLKLFYEVKDAYYEYYYLAKSIDITKENVSLIKHLESVARSRYKTDAGSHPDVIRAQVEMGKVEDRYRSLLDMTAPLAARLNAALNRPAAAEIPWPKNIDIENVQIDDDRLFAMLTEANPELKVLDFEVARNEKAIALAGKDYYPDFTFGVSFIDTSNSLAGNPNDNGKDPVIASVSMTIPLWREKYDASVRQAKSLYHAAIQNKTHKTNSLSADLQMATYRFRDAERKVDLYTNALLPKAKESLKVTESGFRAGTSSFTDLIDAQRILLEFALSNERALTDKAKWLAKLELLVGREIK